MVSVGGGDVVAVQAQEADRQAADRCYDTRRVPGPDRGLVFQVGHVPDPVNTVFYLPGTVATSGIVRADATIDNGSAAFRRGCDARCALKHVRGCIHVTVGVLAFRFCAIVWMSLRVDPWRPVAVFDFIYAVAVCRGCTRPTCVDSIRMSR